MPVTPDEDLIRAVHTRATAVFPKRLNSDDLNQCRHAAV